MALTSTPVSSNLVLVLDYGLNSAGKTQTKERVFKSVAPGSNNEDVFAVAEVILALQEKPHIAVQRRDVVELNNQ